MKYLVISKRKDNAPTSMTAEMEKNQQEVEQRQKDGKIQEMYYVPGLNQVMSIEEHENMTDVLKAIKAGSKFGNFEIFPLMDWKEARDILYK